MLAFTPISEHSWSIRPSFPPGAAHFSTRENDVFFLDTLEVSFAPDLREGLFHVMLVRNQHCDERNELNTCELDSQDATKTTSASADSHVNFSWMIMSFLGENIVFVFGSYDPFFSVFLFCLPAW